MTPTQTKASAVLAQAIMATTRAKLMLQDETLAAQWPELPAYVQCQIAEGALGIAYRQLNDY